MDCKGDEDPEMITEQEYASGGSDAILSGGVIDDVGISRKRMIEIWSCSYHGRREAPVDQIAVSVMDIWGAKTPHY